MSKEDTAFPVDRQLLMVMPRAGASIRNPDVRSPILRADADGYYLEMRVGAGPVSSKRQHNGSEGRR